MYPALVYLFTFFLIAATLPSFPDLSAKDLRLKDLRQVLTRQLDGADVPVPGEQTQNATSTEGAGNGTNPQPGVVPPNPGDSTDNVNCKDVTTGRSNKCWKELGLDGWVEDWMNEHPCNQGEPFASCFLRIEDFAGLDCTGIKISACVAPSGHFKTQPELFYVVYNIYSINQFFLSWWTAMGASSNLAVDNVDQIVQILDPPANTNMVINEILIALSAFFAVVPGPLGFWGDEVASLSKKWQSISQVIANALFITPQIGRFIFPTDTTSSQLVQMASLRTDIVGIIQTVQDNLNKTCVSVMSNVDEFLAFASQGNFSSNPPSLPDQANYLYYAFNTYLISQALNGNQIRGVLALDTNPQALATNGTKLNYDIDCQAYNEQNVCDTWWYSGDLSSAFGLDDFGHMNRNYGDVMTTLLSNYTTGKLLFEGAYYCNAQSDYGTPVNITVNAGGINTGCISQLRILTWDMSCDNPLAHNSCEFLDDQPRQNTFFGSCGSHSIYSVMDQPIYCVPNSYLGPLISQTDVKLDRN